MSGRVIPEEEEPITVLGVGVPTADPELISGILDEEEDEEDITVQGSTGVYTPPGKTVGIYSDDFSGGTGFPNRGKWIPYVGRDGWTSGGYSDKGIYLSDGELCIYGAGAGAGSGVINIGVATRAEFKNLFTLSFKVHIPNDNPGNGVKRFEFSLVDPNPPDRIYGTHLFGTMRLAIYAVDNGAGLDWHLWDEECGDTGLGSCDYDQQQTIIVNQRAFNGGYVATTISRYNTVGGGGSSTGRDLPASKSETWRAFFNLQLLESTGYEIGFYVDDVKVEREKNRLSRALAYVENLNGETPEFYDVTQDLVSVSASERENSSRSLTLTLNTPVLTARDARYITTKTIRVPAEVEVRAGWDYMMWLLFKGQVDELDWDQRTRTLDVVSCQGYGNLLDWRETSSETYNDDADVEIRGLLAAHYNDESELSADWVYGGSGLNLETDSETIASVVDKLVQNNSGYIQFIDFNRSLVFWPISLLSVGYYMGFSPVDYDNLQGIQITTTDTVLNRITVKGKSDTYTTSDPASVSQYGLREKTFSDDTLADLASVQMRAEALLKLYAYPKTGYTIQAPESFIVMLHDTLWWTTYPDVDAGDGFEVKSVEHTFTPSQGLRTRVEGNATRFRISDVVGDHAKRLQGIL